MLVGKRYKLMRPVRAIETINGEMLLTTIQAGGIVEVVAIPTDKSDPLVDVLLEGRTFSLRAVLLRARAEEIVE